MNDAQGDKYSMAEKILRDIETIILNQEVEEFVIIPVTLNQNKSPVVYDEDNLGLESWCVKHVYGYAYKFLLDIRKKVAKRKLLHEEYPNINRLIIGALLINPDVATFWNMRRELVSDNLLPIIQEFKIAKIVLSHKSKSNEAFAYRKWLLRGVLNNNNLHRLIKYGFFTDELKVCDMTAAKAANNYHSWCHRIWCIDNMNEYFFKENHNTLIKFELDFTEKYILSHTSEHTGFYYRQFILNKTNLNLELLPKYYDNLVHYFDDLPLQMKDTFLFLLGPTEKQFNTSEFTAMYNRICILLFDYKINFEMLNFFLGHESIWYHRRFILTELFSLMYNYYGLLANNATKLNVVNDTKDKNIVDILTKSVLPQKSRENGEKCPKILKSESDLMSTSKLYQLLMKTEKQLIEKYSSSKSHQGYLAERHEKWIVYILGITNF